MPDPSAHCTYATRLAHPQARLVPLSMIKGEVFNYGLRDIHLELMTSSWEAVRIRLAKLKTNASSYKLGYWNCIAFSQPALSADELAFLASELDISIDEQLLTAAHLGRMDFLKRFAPEHIVASHAQLLSAAVESGKLPVIGRLIELAGSKVLQALKAKDYSIFLLAAENGDLPVINKLIELASDEMFTMIKSNDYQAFWTAAYDGHLPVINRLIELAPSEMLNMIRQRNYNAFWSAARYGHLPVINRLIELAPGEMLDMIKAKDYSAFRLAYINNQHHVANIMMELAPSEVLNMIKSNNYEAFHHAAKNGSLDLGNMLQELAPAQMVNMIKSNDYEDFGMAAGNGDLAFINKLIEWAPGEVVNMNSRLNYLAFRLSGTSGSLAIINRLLELDPGHEFYMITANQYQAFTSAVHYGHLPVANRLLSFSLVMAYADMHEHEYSRVTHPYIAATITSLRSQRQALEAANPHAVFNLTDDNEIKRCFYMFRNLIRRNDPTLLDDIRFLLDIPAVKALAHQVVGDEGQPNELLRLALAVGNNTAAQILLTIPAVNTLATTQGYYRAEVHAGIDVPALARDRESSMRALTVGENQRLSAVIARYQPIIIGAGCDPLFVHLLDSLKERYAAHPATITKDDGSTLALPFEWSAFTALTLNAAERNRALKMYYQHKDHTALRYLSKPNHWMHPHASYVYINDSHTESWSTFDEYKSLIVMLWLAAKDSTIPPTDGYTLEGRIDHFVDELAHIGRAHNWDESRLRADGHGPEEFDDLTGDKPSCFSGVKRRLFQSVVGHPLLRILTVDDVRQEISAFIYSKFKSHITEANRAELIGIWTGLINLDEVNPAPLKALNISSTERAEFSDYMSTKYGSQFNNEPAFTLLMAQFCPEDGIHAQVCDGLFDMLKLLKGSAVVSAPASPDCFFSAPARAGAGEATPTTVDTAALAQCGCFSFF